MMKNEFYRGLSIARFHFLFAVLLSSTLAGSIEVNFYTTYFAPMEGDLFTWTCSNNDEVREWVLPSEKRIPIENGTKLEEDLEITQDSLTIPYVSQSAVGHYTCIFRNSTQRHLHIPYVLPKPKYSSSILLSLGVSAVFSIICAIVWLVERHFFRNKDDGRRRSSDRMPITRKKADSTSGSDTYSTVQYI